MLVISSKLLPESVFGYQPSQHSFGISLKPKPTSESLRSKFLFDKLTYLTSPNPTNPLLAMFILTRAFAVTALLVGGGNFSQISVFAPP